MNKKSYLFLLILISSLSIYGCKAPVNADIVTTMYPQYDIASNIVKDKMTVRLLTPLGSEVHGYSPTAKDIVSIKQSRLFLYTSDIMERWIGGVIDSSVNAMDLSSAFTFQPLTSTTHVSVIDSVHYWTDPIVIIDLIDSVLLEIIKIDPENSDFYTQNARDYQDELLGIHEDLNAFIATLEGGREVYYFGHNALGAFSYRYQLPVLSLTESYSPDAEYTPKQIENMLNSLIDNNVSYLFIEELMELRNPQSIVTELNKLGKDLTLLELHGYHNVSRTQFNEEVRYADLFKQNVNNIIQAFSA